MLGAECNGADYDDARVGYFQDLIRKELAAQLSIEMANYTTELHKARCEVEHVKHRLHDLSFQLGALKSQQVTCGQSLSLSRDSDQNSRASAHVAPCQPCSLVDEESLIERAHNEARVQFTLTQSSEDSLGSESLVGAQPTLRDATESATSSEIRPSLLVQEMDRVCSTVRSLKRDIEKQHEFSQGVHGLSFRASAKYAILIVMLSAALLLFEILMLFSIVIGGSHPKCMVDADCRHGEFCDFNADAGAAKVGHCRDCYILPINTSAYCMKHDLMPTECDFLQAQMRVATYSHLVIIVFVSLVLSLQIYEDTHQAINELYEFQAVAKPIAGTIRYKLLSPYVWSCTRLREYVVPVMVMGATASLLINEPITVSNIVLNGAGMGFIMSIDDLMGKIIPAAVTSWADPEWMVKETVAHIHHRGLAIQTLVNCVMLVIMVVAPTPIMQLVGDETSVGWHPCSDIVNVCRDFPFLVGLVHAICWIAYTVVTRQASCKSGVIEATCIVVMASLLYRFLRMLWSKYMYLVAHEAFVNV